MSAIRIANVSSNAFQARRINEASSGTVNELPLADTPGRNEIDSLADTSCAGQNWIPLLFAGDTVNVFGHSRAQQDSTISLVTCATKIIQSLALLAFQFAHRCFRLAQSFPNLSSI